MGTNTKNKTTRQITTNVALIVLSLILTTLSAKSRPLTLEDTARLKRGDVVLNVQASNQKASAIIDAAIVIAAAPQQVWSVMTDCARAVSYLENLKSCRVLKAAKDGSWDVREHRVKPALLLPETRSIFRSDYQAPSKITFRKTGGDLKALMGEWHLRPVSRGQKTELTYHAEISMDLPLPNFIIHAAIENDVTTALLALRREVTRTR